MLLKFFIPLMLICRVVLVTPLPAQSTISATDKYAYAANAGWINFRHDQPSSPNGVVVGEAYLSGYAYAANFGWIHFGDSSPANGHSYQNNSATDYGVNHDSSGNLSGMAYGANIGWINFGWANATDSNRPRFDLITGRFLGYAYGANIGWIKLGTTFLKTDTMLCTDSDSDGIGDAWDKEQFGDTTTADDTTDTDGDGQSDFAEYQAQTDPNDESHYLDIVSHRLKANATELDVDFTSQPSRLYILETSETMAEPWDDAGLGMFSPDTGAVTSKTISIPQSSTRKFVRVRPVKPLQP